jgi:hypothetical protein
MNSLINQEIQDAINRHTKNICCTLGNKYNFDVQEAFAYITNDSFNIHNEKYNEKVDVFTTSDDILHREIIGNNNDNDNTEKKKRGRPKKIVDEVKEEKPKKKRGRPKKENKITIVTDTDDEEITQSIKPSTEELIAASITPSNTPTASMELIEDEISDSEEINVDEWYYKGDKYLKDDKNNIYCSETHNKIGRYCVNDDTIITS